MRLLATRRSAWALVVCWPVLVVSAAGVLLAGWPLLIGGVALRRHLRPASSPVERVAEELGRRLLAGLPGALVGVGQLVFGHLARARATAGVEAPDI